MGIGRRWCKFSLIAILLVPLLACAPSESRLAAERDAAYKEGYAAGQKVAQTSNPDMPKLTPGQASLAVATNVFAREWSKQANLRDLMWPNDKSNAVYTATYKGNGLWVVEYGLAVFTLNERTMEVRP